MHDRLRGTEEIIGFSVLPEQRKSMCQVLFADLAAAYPVQILRKGHTKATAKVKGVVGPFQDGEHQAPVVGFHRIHPLSPARSRWEPATTQKHITGPGSRSRQTGGKSMDEKKAMCREAVEKMDEKMGDIAQAIMSAFMQGYESGQRVSEAKAKAS